jgi:hypothetical protein
LQQLHVQSLQAHEQSVLQVAVPGPTWQVSSAEMQVLPQGIPTQQTGPSPSEPCCASASSRSSKPRDCQKASLLGFN